MKYMEAHVKPRVRVFAQKFDFFIKNEKKFDPIPKIWLVFYSIHNFMLSHDTF